MNNENTETVAVQEEQPVTFEVAILDVKEPIKLTPDLIREKSKALTDLVIKDIFDDAGYAAVKKAKALAVKTRTAIEKQEKSVNADLKAEFEKKKKGVTDYTASLYAVCREVEDALQKKMTTIDEEKTAAANKLKEEREGKTTLRENKMYELGMAWNGQNFVGYGKLIGKQFLFEMSDESYELLTNELEGFQVSGKDAGTVAQAPYTGGSFPSSPAGGSPVVSETKEEPFKPFENAIYDRYLPEAGLHLFITNDHVEGHRASILTNDEIGQSKYFVQVIAR